MRAPKTLRITLISLVMLAIIVQILWSPFDRSPSVRDFVKMAGAPIRVVYRYFDFNQKNDLCRKKYLLRLNLLFGLIVSPIFEFERFHGYPESGGGLKKEARLFIMRNMVYERSAIVSPMSA